MSNICFLSKDISSSPEDWLKKAEQKMTSAKIHSNGNHPILESPQTLMSSPLSETSQESFEDFDYPLQTKARKLSSTSSLGLKSNDASLREARKQIRLTKNFDDMLENGFPYFSFADRKMSLESESTVYVSLTPEVAHTIKE